MVREAWGCGGCVGYVRARCGGVDVGVRVFFGGGVGDVGCGCRFLTKTV